jgi:hypothetical protein
MAVNLSPLAGAGWQFFDNNGVILSGGLLYTYAAGTTTPQATYTSSTGVTANANPIVLDSAGRTTNEVWLTSGVVYKFTLKTSTGTTLWTYDNVSGVNDFFIFATSSGSSLIGYLPAAGSATTVQAAIRALQASDLTFALKGANTDITSLASPALASATATTQTAGDNTTKVATTAFVATAGGSQIQPISASVASNALTISASGLALNFRSTTLGSGAVTTVSGTPANLVVPSTATLGTVNAIQSRLVVLALNNAGTIELAVSNIAGGVNLTETGLISTTAISVGATSASTVYSTTARTSVAYRVIGYIESTQTTAGIWATAPSTIQGYGGQALAAMSSLGYGQTLSATNLYGAGRAYGTTYYNTTGKPITVSIGCSNTSGTTMSYFVGASQFTIPATSSLSNLFFSFIVPIGASYSAASSSTAPTTNEWRELR